MIELPPYPASHNMGTNRMSAKARDGVVNKWGQSHDIPNLFVSDGSQFTTSGGQNPTLTIARWPRAGRADRPAAQRTRDLTTTTRESTMTQPNNSQRLWMYEQMLTSRYMEESIERIYMEGKTPVFNMARADSRRDAPPTARSPAR